MTRQTRGSYRTLIRSSYPLPILIGLAAGVRIYLFAFTYIISRDGVVYLRLGEYFKQGNLAKGLAHDYHPLYSTLITAFSYLLPDSPLGGQIISIIAGSLLVVPIFYLGRDLFNESIGFVSGLLVAFHPYLARISADVLSDPLYILLFVTATCLGWKALKTKSLLGFFLTGVFTALAYLTRPEGIGVLLVVGFWILIIERSASSYRRNLTAFVLLVFGFLILASPYLVYLREDTGHWILTRKKSMKGLIGIEKRSSDLKNLMNQEAKCERRLFQPRPAMSRSKDVEKRRLVLISSTYLEDLGKFFHLLMRFSGTFHPLLFLFLLIGISKSRAVARFDKGDWFILSFYFLYLPVLYLLFLNVGYVSRRHWLPLVAIGLFWAAIGIQKSQNWIVQKTLKSNRGTRLSSGRVFTTVMVLTLVILLPKTLKPQRHDKVWMKKAGIWIAKNSPPDPRIMSNDPRVAYYAGGVNIAIPHGKTFQGIENLAGEEGVDFIVLDTDRIGKSEPDLLLEGSKGLALVHQFAGRSGRKTLIWRVLDY